MESTELETLAEMSSSIVPGVLATLLIAVLGGAVSWLVVVKRLSFIGQGVSHAAFGGVGLAMVLGLAGASVFSGLGTMGVVLVFALVAAVIMSALSSTRSARADTAIGIVLSLGMAIGFLLFQVAEEGAREAGQQAPPELEEILFGSITNIGMVDLWIALGTAIVALTTFWTQRHRVVFWMFDETAARAFGVPVGQTRILVMTMLTLIIVVTMKLAGVVLVSAVLILPGAIALQLSDRLQRVVTISIAASLIGSSIGLLISIETGLLPGPTIVLVFGVLYVLAWIPALMQRRAIMSLNHGS